MKNFKNISKLLLVSLIAIAITACSKDDPAGNGDGNGDGNGSAPKCELDLSKLTAEAVTVLDTTAGIAAANVGSDKLFAETAKEGCKEVFKDGKVADKVKIEVKDLKVVSAADDDTKKGTLATALGTETSILKVVVLGQTLDITAKAAKNAKSIITAKLGSTATNSVKKEGAEAVANDADNDTIIKSITDLAFGACLNIENVASGKAKLALTCNATDTKDVAITNADTTKELKVTGSAVADTTLTGKIVFSVVK